MYRELEGELRGGSWRESGSEGASILDGKPAREERYDLRPVAQIGCRGSECEVP